MNIFEKMAQILAGIAQKYPGAKDFESLIGKGGEPSPIAGVDIVSARRHDAKERGIPSFVVAGIDRKPASLEELANTAWTLLECEFEGDADWLSEIRSVKPIEMLQILYIDLLGRWFCRAVYELSRWPVVAIGVAGEDPKLFVNRHPSGSLVNAAGFTSLEELRAETENYDLELLGPADVSNLDCDDTMAAVMMAIGHFNYQPFADLRENAILWAKHGSLKPWIP